MSGILIFNLCQVAISGYALARGGAPERWAGALLASAALGSALISFSAPETFHSVYMALLRLDLALLLGLVIVAALADRFWPIWLAALHLLAIASHGVMVYNPTVAPGVYWFFVNRLAYPMLLLLLIGTVRHRARLAAGGPEYGWTFQRRRSGYDRGSLSTR